MKDYMKDRKVLFEAKATHIVVAYKRKLRIFNTQLGKYTGWTDNWDDLPDVQYVPVIQTGFSSCKEKDVQEFFNKIVKDVNPNRFSVPTTIRVELLPEKKARIVIVSNSIVVYGLRRPRSLSKNKQLMTFSLDGKNGHSCVYLRDYKGGVKLFNTTNYISCGTGAYLAEYSAPFASGMHSVEWRGDAFKDALHDVASYLGIRDVPFPSSLYHMATYNRLRNGILSSIIRARLESSFDWCHVSGFPYEQALLKAARQRLYTAWIDQGMPSLFSEDTLPDLAIPKETLQRLIFTEEFHPYLEHQDGMHDHYFVLGAAASLLFKDRNVARQWRMDSSYSEWRHSAVDAMMRVMLHEDTVVDTFEWALKCKEYFANIMSGRYHTEGGLERAFMRGFKDFHDGGWQTRYIEGALSLYNSLMHDYDLPPFSFEKIRYIYCVCRVYEAKRLLDRQGLTSFNIPYKDIVFGDYQLRYIREPLELLEMMDYYRDSAGAEAINIYQNLVAVMDVKFCGKRLAYCACWLSNQTLRECFGRYGARLADRHISAIEEMIIKSTNGIIVPEYRHIDDDTGSDGDWEPHNAADSAVSAEDTNMRIWPMGEEELPF